MNSNIDDVVLRRMRTGSSIRTSTVLSLTMLSLALALVLALSGCNESGSGIFYSIRNEEAYLDASLKNDLTIGSFFSLGGSYYVESGALYSRSTVAGTVDWSVIDPPASGTDSSFLITGAVPVGTEVAAVVTTVDGTASSLYTYDPSVSEDPWSSAIDVDGDGDTDEYVIGVAAGDSGTLIVNVRTSGTPDTFTSYTTTDAATFTEVDLPTDPDIAPVRRLTSFGGDTWALAGGRLYSDGTGSLALVSGTDAPGADEQELVDLVSSTDLGALLAIASDGTLYAFDGSSWLTPFEVFNEDLAPDQATTLAVVTLGTGEYAVLVGTNLGYLELVYAGALDETAFLASTTAVPGSGDSSTSGSDYAIIDLRRSVVLSFTVADSLLFVGTGGAGLWRTDYDGASDQWNRE